MSKRVRKTATRKSVAVKKKSSAGETASAKITPTAQKDAAGKNKKEFPEKFPFWARFKPSKNRTTLVIDEGPVKDKKTGKIVDGFVHREATHSENKNYERIYPNPDKDDAEAMHLKRPTKRPKKEFKPHNKKLSMPEHLQERYEKNNKKKS